MGRAAVRSCVGRAFQVSCTTGSAGIGWAFAGRLDSLAVVGSSEKQSHFDAELRRSIVGGAREGGWLDRRELSSDSG